MLDKMDRIGTIMLLIFVFYVKKKAECNNDTFAIAGCDVSLNWTLLELDHISITAYRADILHSLGNNTAHVSDGQCNIMDNSSSYCSISERDDQFIISLDIFNVTSRQNGNYILQEYHGQGKKKTSSINLIVIGKPTIKEVLKPILNQTFEITCNTHLGFFEGFMYKWRINGTEITPLSNANAHSISSLGMDDNFNHVTCQVCLNATASNFSSVICEHDRCSVESDPHTIQVIYGPNNISLSRSESHFYLKDHEFFTIDCSAKCNPNCTFRWKGQDTIDSKKLVLTSFESGMAGQYTCHVTNQQTNITSKSNPIVLHHVKGKMKFAFKEGQDSTYIRLIVCKARFAKEFTFTQSRNQNKLKEENVEDLPLMQYWMGIVIVSVLLLFVGCSILVTHWRKSTTRSIDSRELCQPCVGQTNSEVSETKLGSSCRSLPSRAAQENVSKRTKRVEHPNIQRHSGSLQNLSNQTEPFMNQVRENVPLRTLFQASHTTRYQTTNSAYSDNPANNRSSFGQDNWPCIMGRSAPGSRLVKLFTRIKRKNKVPRDDHNIGAGSRGLDNLREDHFGPKLHEDSYSTIDEDAMSVYDHGIDNLIENYSHETGRSTEHVFYDYAYSTEIYHVETTDVHVTDETYITPISDLARPFEIFQDEDTDVLGTDETYITQSVSCPSY